MAPPNQNEEESATVNSVEGGSEEGNQLDVFEHEQTTTRLPLQEISWRSGVKRVMCYGVSGVDSGWKTFLHSLYEGRAVDLWEKHDLPWSNTNCIRIRGESVCFQFPPVNRSRFYNLAALDVVAQASDAFIIFVEGHYSNLPESSMEHLQQALQGRESYQAFLENSNPENVVLGALPKPPAMKTRSVVVLLCGDGGKEAVYQSNSKFNYNNMKEAWKAYCNKEGFKYFEFNGHQSKRKIKQLANTIVETLLNELKAERGLKFTTQYFPQDVDFKTLLLESPEETIQKKHEKEFQAILTITQSNNLWNRFKRFIGVAT